MPHKVNIRSSVQIDSESLEAINKKLRTFNQKANPEFWSKLEQKENEALPLHIIATDENDNVVGGLIGSSQFAWMKINIMAVDEDHRYQGIGTSLVRRAEEIARERDCRYVYLDTMAYQSPEFYRKHDYKEICEIPDWDSLGQSKFLFSKELK